MFFSFLISDYKDVLCCLRLSGEAIKINNKTRAAVRK